MEKHKCHQFCISVFMNNIYIMCLFHFFSQITPQKAFMAIFLSLFIKYVIFSLDN